MIRWTRFAARSAMLTLSVVCAATTVPLAAQQSQAETAVVAQTTSAPAVQAPVSNEAAAPAAPAAGPRVTSMNRVEPKFNTTPRYAQQNEYVNHSYMIYIMVVVILVVLLIFLIRRA